MSAGHDTTATTLTYALWALGNHPDMQSKVRAETDAIGDQELTPDDVPRLRYTVQVLHEALRLCPPAHSIPRLITRDIEVDGHLVKAGTLCTVGVYAMHRDPDLWEDPLRFDPDRFSSENAAGRDRWQYIPFSAGPRTCIGDHFAMLEATLALATIIRRTEIRSLSDDFPVACALYDGRSRACPRAGEGAGRWCDAKVRRLKATGPICCEWRRSCAAGSPA